ncbi:restriction endonuclease subunit S [Stenotrophomonas sp. Marseille-Q5258]|uniref:restriction endonuclease subunit S n=1 Tax=Stenotrophomonas sp. Marseille-Q5258 TaxID=2972779 RepID=UPI0021C86601|nr:restriction endonuclease subunit S [Stenotrophomonas sp. Marseille-Q5258]
MKALLAETESHSEWLEPLFDIAFAAPEGMMRLRQLIVALAMQGKLVPQDPKEAPASELIKQITVAKTALVTAGIIRKPKPLEPIANAEIPYEVPANWKWVRLGEIGLINPRNDVEDDDAEAGFVPMPLIPRDYETGHGFEPRKWGDIKKGYTHFADGDVGMAKITPCFENAKSCVFSGLPNGIGAGTTELHVFRNAFNAIAQRYLLYFLKNPGFIDKAAGKMTGSAGQKRVPTPYFTDLVIPLAPLEEQKRIVARIDELLSRCDEMEMHRAAQEAKRGEARAAVIRQWLAGDDAAAAQLRDHFDTLVSTREDVTELRKAILQLAVMGKLVLQDAAEAPASEFLKKVEVVKMRREREEGLKTRAEPDVSDNEQYCGRPDGWTYCRLGNLAKFIDYRGRTPQKVDAGIPLITAKNVRFGYINREPREYVSVSAYSEWMTRGFPRVGDMLFTTEAPLGNVAIIDIPGEFALAQRVICVQLHAPEIAEFLKIVMMSEIFQSRLRADATGMTATGIKASKLKEIPMPIPPLDEQRRIVARVDALMRLCDMLEQSINAAQAKQAELLAAVMARV